MNTNTIFATANVTKSIAAYLGLIDNISSDVKKLLHQAFKSAVLNLDYAKTSSGKMQLDYIQTAREKFTDAISVEENENLILSYVGLGMCQYHLGDIYNAKLTLKQINNIELTSTERIKCIGGKAWNAFLGWNLREFHSKSEWRVEHFENFKQKVLECCKI